MSKTGMNIGSDTVRQFIAKTLENRDWEVAPVPANAAPFFVVGGNRYFPDKPGQAGRAVQAMVVFQIEDTWGRICLTRFEINSHELVLTPEAFLELCGKSLDGKGQGMWTFDTADSFIALLERYDRMAGEMGYPKLFRLKKGKN